MNALIKKLKNNDDCIIFAKMTPEERGCLNKVGYGNCQVLQCDCTWSDLTGDRSFCKGSIYRIKPDYQPEPKTEDLEIIVAKGVLGIKQNNAIGPNLHHIEFIAIHELLSRPGFRGFWYWQGGIEQEAITEMVAQRIAEGEKVIARFEVWPTLS